MAADPAPVLDAFINGVTVVFILSLAVERVAALFKKRDWQPLSRGRYGKAQPVRVDLRSGKAFKGTLQEQKEVALAPEELKGRMRAANAENTLLIGILLALTTGANAFKGLPAVQTYDSAGLMAQVAWLMQICLTGAAAGIGSSFWYDLLGLLAEVRRTRAAVSAAQPEDSVPPIPAASLLAQEKLGTSLPSPAAALQASAMAGADFFTELKKSAEAQIPELEKRYGAGKVKVVEVPRRPDGVCIAFQVAVDSEASKSTLPGAVSVQVTPPARRYSVEVTGGKPA